MQQNNKNLLVLSDRLPLNLFTAAIAFCERSWLKWSPVGRQWVADYEGKAVLRSCAKFNRQCIA